MYVSNFNKRVREGVSIVIPVLDEAGNIGNLIESIRSLPKDPFTRLIKEIVIIDDGSKDGTVDIVKALANTESDISLILKERKVKNGTVNAQLYGMSVASHDSIIIMDGDLQHPVMYIKDLIKKYMEGYELVIASRYLKGGVAYRTPYHGMVSRTANLVSKVLMPWIHGVKDQISGFFIVNRRIVPLSIDMHGFNKLLLYILSSSKRVSFAEVPYHFIERAEGSSKVASGGISYILKFISEIKYYRYLRSVALRGTRNRRPTSNNLIRWKF